MLQSQTAAWPDLYFIASRNFQRQARCHCLRHARNKYSILQTADIEACIFGRSVRIFRKAGVAVKLLDSDSHANPLS